MTEPRKPHPTPEPGSYRSILPNDDTPPQGSRRTHVTPAAGIEVPRERPPQSEPKRLPQDNLRGLGSDPDEAPRSKLYAKALSEQRTDQGRWAVNVEWTGRLLDGQDSIVRMLARLNNTMEEMRFLVASELSKLTRQDSIHDLTEQELLSGRAEDKKAREEMAAKVAAHDRLLMAKGAAWFLGIISSIAGVAKIIWEVSEKLK